MMTKNELKYYSSLLQKKYRISESKFLAEGEKIVLEGISANQPCELIAVTNDFIDQNPDIVELVKSRHIKLELVSNSDFQKLSDTKTPQGIIAVFIADKPELEMTKLKDEFIVYLDNISDPGNVGTIIRTAEWFGIKRILISKNSAEYLNPKVIRASMGAIFHTKIHDNIDSTTIVELKQQGYNIYCSDLNGKDLDSIIPKKKSILVFSNESAGPSLDIINLADEVISISGKGKTESLNVSIAAGIIISRFCNGS